MKKELAMPRSSPRLSRLIVPLACLLLAVAGCGGVSQRIMSRVVEKNLRSNPTADLADGLHVLVCGAGGPLFDARRGGPCVAIIAGETVVVVDQGSGATRTLGRLGIAPGFVEDVFLTHFHSDHIDGLGELATLRWAGGGWPTPLPVHGPAGIERVVAGFNEAYAADRVYRHAHHGEAIVPLDGHGLAAVPFETPRIGESPVVFERDGLRVRSFLVDHAPVAPAVGYRFDYKGRSVVVSGDTVKSANLIEASRGVDLLIHEALSPELVGIMNRAALQAGNGNMAKITADILDYHASPVEAAESAEAADAKALLFYHVVPPLPLPGLERVYLEGVSKAFSGKALVAVDGSFVSLLPGTDRIEFSER
jgi:ribonuclease Z